MATEKKDNLDPEMGKLIEPKVSSSSAQPTKDSAAYAESKKGSAGKALSSCLLYTFCSVSMVLVNKSLASRCVNEDICPGNCIYFACWSIWYCEPI